jgi:hypothetical protein
MLISTLTAEFVPFETYVRTYAPILDVNYMQEYEEGQHDSTLGVVLKFGDAVVKHWYVENVYYRDMGYSHGGTPSAEETAALEEIVARKLARLFVGH